MTQHFIVCGLGLVGYRVVHLLRRLDEPVTVVTQGGREDWLHEVQARGATVVCGDARDHDVLRKANITGARALIAATGQDLVNIELVLDAKELCPDLPIVLRLFDQSLARHFEAAFAVRRALGMSALAAPSFVAAALGEQVAASFAIEGTLFAVGHVTLDEDSPLVGLSRQQVGEQHHLAVFAREQGSASEPPSAQSTLLPGNRVTMLGTAASWEQQTRPTDNTRSRTRLRRERLKNAAQYLNPRLLVGFARQVWRNAPLPLRAVFTVLNLLIFLSVFVFRYAMDLSFVDALYFIITTVTTTGYGDITPRNASDVLKLYGCLVMLLGSATIATLYALLTDFIVTARFQQVLGRQRIPQENHTVVVGLGNVGFRIVEELRRAGVPTVVIERDPDSEFVETVRAHALVLIGDARLPDTLGKANVAKAHALISATSDDAVNLSVGLSVATINPAVRTVLRLFDAEFARKVQAGLNIDMALSASLLAAPTFVAAALYPDVGAAFVLDDQLCMVLSRTAGDAWQNQTPAQLRAEQNVDVLMVRRATDHGYAPADDALLHPTDQVLALVKRDLAG